MGRTTEKHTYFCGVYRNTRGGFVPFFLRKKGDDEVFKDRMTKMRKRINDDGNLILEEQVKRCTYEQAKAYADALKAIYELQNSNYSLHPGSVVEYLDGGGAHTAVLLKLGARRSFMLFATSNPEWNPGARKITADECALLGYPDKGRDTYFAPVVRDNEFMHASGKEFPQHRVAELINEFKEFDYGTSRSAEESERDVG